MENKGKDIKKKLDVFLNTDEKENDLECSGGTCVIKGDKSLVERINKKIITEDGRQLLF